MGLAYGLVSATVTSSLIYLMPNHSSKTGVGLLSTAINGGLVLTSILCGRLGDEKYNEPDSERQLFLASRLSTAFAILGLSLAVALHIYDRRQASGLLSLNLTQQAQFLARSESENAKKH